MAFWSRGNFETGNEVGETEQKNLVPEKELDVKENPDGRLDGDGDLQNSCKSFRESMKVDVSENNDNKQEGKLDLGEADSSSDFTGANNGLERSKPSDEGR